MGGTGPAIDYAVKMHRFPQEALLDRVAKAGGLTAAQVEAFARSVAGFHDRVARADADGAFGSPGEILAEAVDNFAQLEQPGPPGRHARGEAGAVLVDAAGVQPPGGRTSPAAATTASCANATATCTWATWRCSRASPWPSTRSSSTTAFRWIDVMNEVAFPVMDLVHHGLPRLAHRFIDAYLDETGDFAGLRVLRFYLVYRAMVRAKVSGIRAHQPGDRRGRPRALGTGLSRPPGTRAPALAPRHTRR